MGRSSYGWLIDQGRVMATRNTTTLSSEFQISIPKAVRIARHWEAGQVFAFIPQGEGMLLVSVPGKDRLRGIAKGASARNHRDRADPI